MSDSSVLMSEKRFVRLHALLRAMRHVNQLLTRVSNQASLIQEVCDNLVDILVYQHVWLVLIDDSDRCYRAASAGFNGEFSSLVKRIGEGFRPACINKALRQDSIVVIQERLTECPNCPLHDAHNGHVVFVKRLEFDDKVFGTFCASVPESYGQDRDEMTLFEELSDEIAFALDRIAKEEKRKESEEQLRFQATILDQIQDRVTVTDMAGNILYVNESVCETLKRNREDLIGCSVKTYGEDPTQGATQKEIINETLKAGSWRGEVINTASDGSQTVLECRTWVVRDERGQASCLCGIATDITARTITEHALKESENRFRRLFETMAQGVVYQNSCGAIIMANPAAERILGMSLEEMVGKSSSDRCWNAIREDGSDFPGEHHPAMLAFRTGKPVQNKVMGVVNQRTKKRTWILVNAIPLFDFEEDTPSRVYTTFVDITERKELEEQLRQLQKMEAVGQLAGGVAHDFNNALTGIVGFLDLAEEEAPENVRELIRHAHRASTRAMHLVKRLLRFSRKSNVATEPTDVNQLVKEVADLMRQTVDRRIDIDVRTEENLPVVMADGPQITSVLANLCVNARDAIQQLMCSSETGRTDGDFKIVFRTRSVSIDSTIAQRHPQAREGRFVVLTVSDNGIGMSDEVKQRIFDPFFTTKGKGKGTGLGLSSAYMILSQHHGWMDVHSFLGKGTTFELYLPITKDKTNEPAPVASSDLPKGTETVLLVDDEEPIRLLGKNMLKRYGYNVMLAVDGKEAVQCFKEERDSIDLIIVDLSMPRMSGREFLQAIREIASDVKIIVSTGYECDVEKESLDSLGVDAYMPKPYRPSELVRKIRNVLDEVENGENEEFT